MKRFEHLLRATIGLDAESIGSASIQRAVRLRMKSRGLKRLEDYEHLLERSPEEWNEFVESVIVTETWFFRDPPVIAAFARQVVEQWLPARPAAPLRVLSLACASGEEPYSLVMGLLDAGMAPGSFVIEAVDISARAVARAERGVYGKNSFRGKDLAFRDRYFQPSKEGFVLAPAIRRCVRFEWANLLNEDAMPRRACYDFIFCRNLLIYFDRPTQRRAIERIERLLAPSGILFVGPVEQPLVLHHGFVSADIPKASACRKADGAARRPGPAGWSQRLAIPAGPRLFGASGPQRTASSKPTLPPARSPSPSVHPEIESARRLADAGHLDEAAQICEAHLRQNGACAQAFYLLGLVRDAGGDASAMDCYRKALYLDPNHYESLLQMALLLQKNGELARARAFKARALRAQARPD